MAAAAPEQSIQVKLVLLGEAAVGKSSVVLQFVSNEFHEHKEPTIGAAFLTQKCRLDDRVLRYEIWDTAGQERFHSLAPMYYRNAQAAVVVYDVTKGSSLEKAKAWVTELQRQASPEIVIALAGNKVDLVAPKPAVASSATDDEEATDDATAMPSAANEIQTYKREVPTEEAEQYAQEAGLLYFETSAKTGEGIVEMFTEIAKKLPLNNIQSARKVTGADGAAPATGVNLDESAKKGVEACRC